MQPFGIDCGNLPETAYLACAVCVGGCRNECNPQWQWQVSRSSRIAGDNTSRTSKCPRSPPLDRCQCTFLPATYFCVISAASSFALNCLLVYWYPRSLCNRGLALGYACTAISKVSKTSWLLLFCRWQRKQCLYP